MNPTELNWKGYTGMRAHKFFFFFDNSEAPANSSTSGFFWMGTALMTITWAFFRLTETKDRTFEELDIMFGEKVPTRKFGSYVVDAYAELNHGDKKAETELVSDEKV